MNTLLTTLSAQRLRRFHQEGHWGEHTLYDHARQHADRAPDAFAVRDGSRRLTYAELCEAADHLAGDLGARGVRRGQRVAVWLPSRVECAVALLACSRMGFVFCPSLHRDHTVEEVLRLLQRVSAAALVYQHGYGAGGSEADLVEGLAAMQPSPLRYPLRAAAECQQASVLLQADGAPVVPSSAGPAHDPDEVVYLAFTSGTTAEPKGVLHTDNTLLANARAISADWHFDAGSVIYTMSPLSHNLGLGGLICTLLTGAELVVHDQPRGASVLARLRDVGATFLIGVPTHAIDLLAELRADAHGPGLPSLHGFRISGAAMPAATLEALIAHGIRPQSGYGMTEACSHHYTLPDDPPERIASTSGRACAGYEVQVFDQADPDRALPAGEVGQIGGRGASLMLGYFDDQAATEAAFNHDGWFMTGDLGRMDGSGYLQITGRIKDLIVRGGHNIFPARIEALAARHATVARAAAVAVPDERLGEKVCLVISRAGDEAVEAAALLEHLSEQGLSRYELPEYLAEMDDFPLTASGKVLKRAISEALARGDLTPVPVATSTAR